MMLVTNRLMKECNLIKCNYETTVMCRMKDIRSFSVAN